MKYCFVHIPKTAGKAFAAEIRRWTNLPSSNNILMANYYTRPIGNFTFYGGHTFYSMVSEVLPPDTKYITLLRDPVNRAYSHWQYLIEEGSIRRYGWVGKPTFSAFIRDERTRTLACNFQSRYLIAKFRPPENGEQQWRYQHKIEMMDLGVDQQTLSQQALDALSNFTIIGTQERFKESVIATCRLMVGNSPPRVNIIEKDYYKRINEEDMTFLLEENLADLRIFNAYKNSRLHAR